MVGKDASRSSTRTSNHVIGTIRLAPLAEHRLPLGWQHAGARAAHRRVRQRHRERFRISSNRSPSRMTSPTFRARARRRMVRSGSTSTSRAACRQSTSSRTLEAFATLNMNVGVPFEPVGKRLFNTNPFAVAFKRSADEGFIALAATNRLLRVTLNDDGSPTINPPVNAADPGNIIRIELKDPAEIGQVDPDDTIGGKNPRGVVLNSNRHSRLRDGLPLARHRHRRRVGRRPDAVQDAGPHPVG